MILTHYYKLNVLLLLRGICLSCPPPVRGSVAGPVSRSLGFLPLIPLSWRQEKWRTRMAATHLLPSPKVSFQRQKSSLELTFYMSEQLFKRLSTRLRRVFKLSLSVFERWRWIKLKLLGAGSVTGVGLTINRLTQPVALHVLNTFSWLHSYLFLVLPLLSLLIDIFLSSSLADTCSWHFVNLSKC